jgi:hypothetical protein
MDWRVTRYRHPIIFVQHSGGEIVEFPVSDDGAVEHNGRFDLGDAKRAEPTRPMPTAFNRGRWVAIGSGGLGMASFIIGGIVGMVVGLNIGFFAYAILEMGKT